MKPIAPLVELHAHLDGALRLATMLEIAREEGVRLPASDEDGLRKALRCGEVRASLAQYLEHFAHTTSVMRSRKALARIAAEFLEDAAKDAVKYAEVRFMPSLHAARDLSENEVMEAVLEGLTFGGLRTGVRWGLIVCSLRNADPAVTGRMVDLALTYRKNGVVAVDLAGDDNLQALDHAPHFRRAKARGLRVTIHAAEEGPPRRIREAIELFGADRVGHAVKAVSDPRMIRLLAERGVGVEACLTSNLQTRTAHHYATHPAREYLRQGVLVSLSTDNRMLADTTMTGEFLNAAQHWRLSDEELRQLVQNAIATSFAPPHVKEALLADLQEPAVPPKP